ncbi:type II secretion system F family protein [bacterium]|nr:type II secretion system F family protein [bacterium]
MALFEFRAIDKTGKPKKGKIDAASIKQATSKLKSQGLHIISISNSKEWLKLPSKKNSDKSTRKKSIPSKVITNFTRQLSILLSTGIPYVKAFDILIEESEHPSFQNVLSEIKAQIVEGSSLAGALQNQSNYFQKMYVAMVKAGEAGGTLSGVLDRLAQSREEREALVSKIQSALIYPIIMVSMGISIVTFMVTFIIPKIVPVFQQFDVKLPLPTRIIIAMSNSITSNWLLLIIFIICSVIVLWRLMKTNQGERIRDSLILKIPVIGTVINKIIVFRFTQTLGTLLTSGVELNQSLNIVKYAVGNRVFEDKFDQINLDITQKGMDLSQALRKSLLFPITIIQMIRVGEEASKLEEMLEKMSIIQENEIKQSLDKVIALLEPISLLGMAVMVGFIVMAVMMPMFKMNQLI